MPVYEYVCKACGHHLEVAQSFKDEPLTTCPSCGGALRKVFGSIGIVLKGSGFYRTDSRTPPGKKRGEKAPAAGEKSDEKTGEKAGGEKSGGEKSGGEKAGDAATGGADKGSAGGSTEKGTSGGADKGSARAAAQSA
jgi:putative FmdB family regulatory protein